MVLAKSLHLRSSSKRLPDCETAGKYELVLTYCRYSDKYTETRFYKLDVDEVPEVAQELSVRAMPTFLLFKDGEKVGEVVGANPTALETAIKNNV